MNRDFGFAKQNGFRGSFRGIGTREQKTFSSSTREYPSEQSESTSEVTSTKEIGKKLSFVKSGKKEKNINHKAKNIINDE